MKEQTADRSSKTSDQLKTNIRYSLIVKALHVFLNLFLIRYCLSLVGEDSYGLWVSVLSVFTLLSCVEVGLNNGARKNLTKAFDSAKAEDYNSRVNSMFSQALIHYMAIFLSLALLIFFTPVNEFFDVFHIPALSFKLTLVVSLFFYCLHFVAFTANTILLSIHKAKDSFIWFFLQSVMQLGILFALDQSGLEIGFNALCLTLSVSPAIVWIVAIVYYKREILGGINAKEILKFKPSKLLKDEATRRFFLLQLALLALLSTDSLLIYKLDSPAGVSTYQVALKYFNVLVIGFNTILVPFWSAFTKEHHSDSKDWIVRKLKQLLIFWIVISMGGVIMLFLSERAYSLWISADFNSSYVLSGIVLTITLQTLWISMFAYYLNSTEKIKLQTQLYLAAAVLNLPLSYFLGSNYGSAGVLIGSIISMLPLALLLPLECRKQLRKAYE